jgi:putative DNA primase/helicase
VGEIFDQRRELVAFIRRALGYTLSGDTSERALFVCHGGGGNGKSTLLETIADMLGDYAMRTPAETLMVKREGQIPNDVAALRGARYVHASETEEGRRLAESFVKDLTGRDTLAARFMRGEWFQFRPVCKVWLRTNHKPVIRGTDEAMWDRLRLIPFEVRIPEHQQDRELPHKLREELPGILAWAVTGCLLWQVNGLGTPERVRAATQGYRDEMDRLGDFVDDCCVVTVEAQVTTKAIYSIYMAWCQRNGEPPLNRRAFAERLQERGFRPVRIGHEGARGWAGVGLLTPEG